MLGARSPPGSRRRSPRMADDETCYSQAASYPGRTPGSRTAIPATYHPAMSHHLDARTLRALVRAMPKAELHLHLDGSLRIDTALEIARTRDVDGPHTFAGMRRALVA